MKAVSQRFISFVSLTSKGGKVVEAFERFHVTGNYQGQPDLWMVEDFNCNEYIVSENMGVFVDGNLVDVDQYARALKRGFSGSIEYFAPGYNRLMEIKLRRFDFNMPYMLTSEDALNEAVRAENEGTGYIDEFIAYAELLQQFEALIDEYKKQAALECLIQHL